MSEDDSTFTSESSETTCSSTSVGTDLALNVIELLMQYDYQVAFEDDDDDAWVQLYLDFHEFIDRNFVEVKQSSE